MRRVHGRVWLAAALPLLGGCREQGKGVATPGAATTEAARFVGRAACAACHEKEVALWKGSHHDLAMQQADATTVLGDFANATFRAQGVVSTFYRSGVEFFVRTDGPDGRLHDYKVAYTFGVRPLQQYLVAFPGGRYQALSLCWDSRPVKAGGQRWFRLYPDERITHDDAFHWTGPYQNWNFMCAECHSTNVRKGYDPATDRYETTWSEVDVSCEACHGPGSAHVAWAEAVAAGRAKAHEDDPRDGLVASLRDPAPATWKLDAKRGMARRSAPRTSHVEVETCARCHARRSVVTDDYAFGRPLMDTHRPVLLDEASYYADGQIKDEVFEYGSFLQSRMYRAGVTCSDCHDPHSLRVQTPVDSTCARCHLRARFDTPAHHFHAPSSRGASCIGCHMPSRTYMVVDPRHDHSFRVPRPDLSVTMGTPNACSGCHRDRPERWAALAAARWWPALSGRPHYAQALHAGREVLPGAASLLASVVEDGSQPGIVRATAASLLRGYPGPGPIGTLERSLRDDDPMLRSAAISAISAMEPRVRFGMVHTLLRDPVRVVRIDAARALATTPRATMTSDQDADLAAGLAEYRDEQATNGDRAEAYLNLGRLDAEMGRIGDAEGAFTKALSLNRWLPSAYLDKAELERRKGRDDEGERVLRKGLTVAPKDPELHHALGLLLVRQKRLAEAVASLQRAAALDKARPRYAYAYGVALQSTGQVDRALAVLKKAHERHAGDAEVLIALTTISRDKGSFREAAAYARELVEVAPEDQGARRLLSEVEAALR